MKVILELKPDQIEKAEDLVFRWDIMEGENSRDRFFIHRKFLVYITNSREFEYSVEQVLIDLFGSVKNAMQQAVDHQE